MFLFTSPATTGQAPPSGTVVDAIRRGAERTGTDFGYLLNTAKRESALDPSAKAPTSSASGLFQFIEQTWLGLVKSDGQKFGLGDLAGAIAARDDGGYAVADAGARQAILKLREDPALASLMAGTLTQQNREALASATGREPSSGELYMAHLLGPQGASDLIRAAGENPGRAVALDMPDAAAANRAVFYDRAGRPRGAGELYAMLSAPPAGQAAARPAATGAAAEPAMLRPGGPALYGLFQTGGRTGPISDAVAKLWKVNNVAVGRQQAAISFFPRVTTEPDPEAVPEAAAPPSLRATGEGRAVPPASVPLPPPRPPGLVANAGARRP